MHSPFSPASISPGSFSPSLHAMPEASYLLYPWCPRTILPTHSFPVSWYLPRAPTQSQLHSVPTTHQNCHRPWSAQEALGTPGPHPSSECGLRVERAHGGSLLQVNPGLGGGNPQPAPSPTKSSLPHSPHAGGGSQENLDNDTETDSLVSAQRERPRRRDGPEHSASSLNRRLPSPSLRLPS